MQPQMSAQDQAAMMNYYYGNGQGQQAAQPGMGGMQGGYAGMQGQGGMTPAQMQMQMAMMQQMAAQGGMPSQQQQMQQYAAMQQMHQMQGQMQAAMAATQPSMSSAAPAFSPQAAAPAAEPAPAAPVQISQLVEAPVHSSQLLEVHTVGIFLEEIAYFLDDMERDLWWLLRFAHQTAGPPAIVRGVETLQALDPAKEAAIEKLRERAVLHEDAHASQVRAKIVIVPSVDKAERGVLNALKKLKFHCKGQVEVFPTMKEANNSAIWAAYFSYVASLEPQWMMKTDGPGGKSLFARCAIIVPVYVDRNKKEIKLFNVWCPDKKKRHWTFPGGDILRGSDHNLNDTCRRQFHNQVGAFFGRSWKDCFLDDLPQEAEGQAAKEAPGVCSYIQLEKDGHRYPSRPHFFMQVTEDFYESSRCYEDNSGVIKLPKPEGDFVHWDDLGSAKHVHLDGSFFAAHEEARWVKMDYETGMTTADDSRPMRKENADLLRLQPEKVWKWLANLAGLEVVVRNSTLPPDFPEDGPFAVRVSGIDKTATDEDIKTYFDERDVKVEKVEQFEVPRHTARVDFADRATLEVALQLSGHNLLRRKVKVELWADTAETSVFAPGAKALKPYDGPMPDEPPYKVIIKGLDKNVDRRDLGYFFWDRDCQVKEVDYPLKNERHAGMLEFENVESLQKAMGLNGAVFKGREITISFPTKDDNRPTPGSRSGDGGKSSGGKGSSKSGGDRGYERSSDRGGDGDRRDSRREERQPPSRAEFGTERPRMELKPRSKPMPGEPGYREEAPKSSGRPDPFGGQGVAPAGDRFKSTRADADSNWRR
mmetsp:Transcript_63128/g.113618  ORF Transcript_63128/g.113618 Transcript_63128/m.113618 type:complete len:817 (-) Transcript_63128:118-2568(-)